MSCVCMQISYYDISRGVYDLAGRVKVTGTMGVPLCLSSAVDEKTEQENIIYGDDSGAAIMLQCGRGELPARVLKPGDFQYVHDDHTDWVTQVMLCRRFTAQIWTMLSKYRQTMKNCCEQNCDRDPAVARCVQCFTLSAILVHATGRLQSPVMYCSSLLATLWFLVVECFCSVVLSACHRCPTFTS